jgi:hypothetical protein
MTHEIPQSAAIPPFSSMKHPVPAAIRSSPPRDRHQLRLPDIDRNAVAATPKRENSVRRMTLPTKVGLSGEGARDGDGMSRQGGQIVDESPHVIMRYSVPAMMSSIGEVGLSGHGTNRRTQTEAWKRIGLLSFGSFDGDGSEFDDFTDDEDEDHIYENPQHVVTALADREKFRQRIAEEFLDNDQKYVEKLNFLKKIKTQLESINSVQFILPPEEIDKMFPYIDRLYRLHCHQLIPAFQNGLRNWTEQSTIGHVFLTHMAELNLYESYIKASPRVVKTLEMWRSKDSKVAKLLQIFQQNSAAGQLDLTDICQEPYIKLQRWRLLLQRYEKYIPENNKDVTDVPRVIRAIEAILKACQDDRDQADNLEKLLILEEQIDGLIVFLTSDTKFIKDGPIIQIDPRSQKIGIKAMKRHETPLHMFLFSDFILICTAKQSNKKHTVCSKILLSSTRIFPADCLKSMGYAVDRCLILQSTKKAVPLMFQNSTEKENWEMTIEKARLAAACRLSIKSRQRDQEACCAEFSCAPIWLPDESSPCCMLCFHDFSVIRWRHHCRGCGILVCSSCASNKLRLPYMNMETNIVCQNCYSRARRLFPNLLPTDSKPDSTVSLTAVAAAAATDVAGSLVGVQEVAGIQTQDHRVELFRSTSDRQSES